MAKAVFKGWTVPGPEVPGSVGAEGLGELGEPGAEESLDALSGQYRIFQLKDGHRFSTDDLLVAWYGTSWAPCARTVLDLGSGIGSVGMVAAWRLQGARFVTIEAQVESVRLARKSVAYNGLEGRYDIRLGDFRDPSLLGENERFDLVLGSPPYFPSGSGVQSEHPQKQACRFEMRGNVGDYCRVAAACLEPGGIFACVFPIEPAEQQRRVELAAGDASLQIVRKRPVVLREGEAPLLALFAMSRLEDLPERFHGKTWVEPPLVIRCRDGSVHPEYQALKLAIGFPP